MEHSNLTSLLQKHTTLIQSYVLRSQEGLRIFCKLASLQGQGLRYVDVVTQGKEQCARSLTMSQASRHRLPGGAEVEAGGVYSGL